MNNNLLSDHKSGDSSQECNINQDKCLNNNNDEELQYYEYGAHFPYQALCIKLEEYLNSIESTAISENDHMSKKSQKIFNVSISDKSRNINLNNNIRQNNIHINNQKKGITVLVCNKNNATAQNIKPNSKILGKENNDSRRKGAINIHLNQLQHPFPKYFNHQKEIIDKKTTRASYSTSHPKNEPLNIKKEKYIHNENNSKSNPIARKHNFNIHFISNPLNLINSKNDIKLQKSIIKKKQNQIMNSIINKVQSTSIPKEKGKMKTFVNAVNNITKQLTKNNPNCVILSTTKNQIKSIETRPHQLKQTTIKENKSRNCNNVIQNQDEKSIVNKEDTILALTFANSDQNKIQPNNQNEKKKKPLSLEKPSIIHQIKEAKILNMNLKKQKDYRSTMQKLQAKNKRNLSSNQNSPNISKSKMKEPDINTTVEFPKKISSINKYSSRNVSCKNSKHSVMSTTSKQILTTKRIAKEKLGNRLVTTNTESTSGFKVSATVTTTNHSPKDKQYSKKKIDSYSKMKTKSNSITSNCSKGNGSNVVSKHSFVKSANNGSVVKKAQFVSFLQLNKKK